MIGTSCRFCEFNIKDENNQQIGCELNLVQRYQEKGVPTKVVEFDDEHGKGNAIELETFCIFRRPPGWKDAVKPKIEAGKTYEDITKDEWSIETTIIVFVSPDNTFDEVKQFVEQVNKMTVLPSKLLFVNYARISPLLFKQLDNLCKMDWAMEFILKQEGTFEQLRNRGMDLASKKVKTPYFISVDLNEGPNLGPDYIEIIKSAFVDKLDKFVCIKADGEGKPAFYQTAVYRFVRGNEQAKADEKIELLAEQQECLSLVKTQTEVFPSLK